MRCPLTVERGGGKMGGCKVSSPPIVLACLLIAPSAAQEAEPRAPAAPAGDEIPLRFAFITCCKDSPFYEPVKKGMHDAAKKMGVTCDWFGTEGVDIPAQVALVRRAVADGYNGIALSIIDPKAFDAVVEEAIKRGVPVVAFNVDDNATPNARLSGISQRFVEAGNALAARVAADVPKNAHVLAMLHDRGISALDERLRGIQEALKEKNVRWTVVVTGIDAAKADKLHRRRIAARPGDSRRLRHRASRYRGGRPRDRKAVRRPRLLGGGLRSVARNPAAD